MRDCEQIQSSLGRHQQQVPHWEMPGFQAKECVGESSLLCPFTAGLNPHVEQVHRKSLSWVRRMGLLNTESAFEHLASSEITWLVGRAFGNAPAEALQLAADWTTLFCLLDDFLEDNECFPLKLTNLMYELHVVWTTASPGSEDNPFELAMADLRRRLREYSTSEWLDGFAANLKELFTWWSWEAVNRFKQLKPDVRSYCEMRKITVGLYPQFHFACLTDGIELPAHIRTSSVLRRLEQATSNCVGWSNDIFTYKKELHSGEIHNLVFRLQDCHGLSLELALGKAVAMHNAEIRLFQQLEDRLDAFGDWEFEVRRYVGILKSWIRGHLDWAFETGRYSSDPEFVGWDLSE